MGADRRGRRSHTGRIFEAERSGDCGAKRLPEIAERQLGILNLSAFLDTELALGDPRAPARPIEFGNLRGSETCGGVPLPFLKHPLHGALDKLASGADIELLFDFLAIGFDGFRTQMQLLGNLSGAVALSNEFKDLELAV